MKKLLLLLAAVLLLNGCQAAYPNEYLSIREHEAPFAYKETAAESSETETEAAEREITVTHTIGLRDAIIELIKNGEERGVFCCVNYDGNLWDDMQKMYTELLNTSPKYSYAMDSFDWTIERQGKNHLVRLSMKLRFTPEELEAIPTKLSPGLAINEICRALSSGVSSYTIQISGYQETDFLAVLEDYMLRNPDQIVDAPEIYVSVFPDRGNVRVVELRFARNSDQETLRQHSQQTRTSLELIANQAALAGSPEELVETLYKQLVGVHYESSEEATVYSLVIQKNAGDSRSMASVAAYLCRQVGVQCELVIGERDGEPWYWNRIVSHGRWYHFDLHAAALDRQLPTLRLASEMTGYTWDEARYPPMEEPEPREPEESTEAEIGTEAPETQAETP